MQNYGLLKFHLVSFAFVAWIFCVITNKLLPRPMSQRVSLMFSSNIIVSGLPVKSLIHFEFIFVYSVRVQFNCFTLNISNLICWKDYSVPIYQRSLAVNAWVYIWDLNSISLVCIFLLISYCFGYSSFVTCFAVRKHEIFSFVLFFKISWLFRTLCSFISILQMFCLFLQIMLLEFL